MAKAISYSSKIEISADKLANWKKQLIEFRLLYKTFLKPIWCYGIQQWARISPSNIEQIQRTQNKILIMTS